MLPRVHPYSSFILHKKWLNFYKILWDFLIGLYFPIILSSLGPSLTICRPYQSSCNGALQRAEVPDLGQIKIGFPSPLWSVGKKTSMKSMKELNREEISQNQLKWSRVRPASSSCRGNTVIEERVGTRPPGASPTFSPCAFHVIQGS